MADDGRWTLGQLSERVAQALAVDYDGQRSGRVREVPNGRTIRWYTTIGLVDRPAEMRGRTAVYTRRHLLQLVAVKRLQADGRSLAAVQRELVGATDKTLERIARLPAAGPAPAPPTRTERDRFWTVVPDGDTVTTPPARVHGIRLHDSVTVLLDAASRAPNEDELAEIEAAAAPLIDVLRRLRPERPIRERKTP